MSNLGVTISPLGILFVHIKPKRILKIPFLLRFYGEYRLRGVGLSSSTMGVESGTLRRVRLPHGLSLGFRV